MTPGTPLGHGGCVVAGFPHFFRNIKDDFLLLSVDHTPLFSNADISTTHDPPPSDSNVT